MTINEKLAVAGNVTTSIEWLDKLSKDPEKRVREFVANNPSCPLYILRELAEDEWLGIRCRVASNPNCDRSLLEELFDMEFETETRGVSSFNDSSIKKYIAKNPNCPSDLIEKIYKFFKDRSYDNAVTSAYANIASNLNTPVNILKEIAKFKSKEILASLAGNPNCPKEAFSKMLSSNDNDILLPLSRNPVCTRGVFEKLAVNPNDFIRDSVKNNPSCPKYVKEFLEKDYSKIFGFLKETCDIQLDFKFDKNIYYLFFTLYCSSLGLHKRKTMFKDINDKIMSGEFDDSVLYYITTLKDYEFYFSQEVLQKLISVRDNFNKRDDYKEVYILGIKKLFKRNNKKNNVFDFSFVEGVKPYYVTDFNNSKKDNKGTMIAIECNNISSLEKKCTGYDSIEYGYYPQDKASLAESTLLEVLFNNKALEKTGKKYTVNRRLGMKSSYDEYEINGRRYIRMGPNEFIEVKPILWRLDRYHKRLISSKPILVGVVNEKSTSDFFKEAICEQIEDEKKERKLNQTNIDKSSNEDRNKKDDLQKLHEFREKAYVYVAQAKKLNDELLGILDKRPMPKVDVPVDVIIKKVDDHYEFSEVYIEYLKYINLSYVPTDNLKLSGLDLTDTNLSISDPKKVWHKDFRGTILGHNTVFADFEGCDLRGADVSLEVESIFDGAIIDENTKLPPGTKVANVKKP